MKALWLLAGTTTAGVILGVVAIAAAPSASAADVNVSVSCTLGNDIDTVQQITAAPGDRIVVTVITPDDCMYLNTTKPIPFASTGSFADPVWVVRGDALPFTWGGPDESAIEIDSLDSNCDGDFVPYCGRWWYLTIAAAASPEGPRPLPWHQSYGRATKDASCSDGWNPSYAAWPNDGKGGWVCDRTLEYNDATKTWEGTT